MFFLVPKQALDINLSFHFLLILPSGPPGRPSPQLDRFSFVVVVVVVVVVVNYP